MLAKLRKEHLPELRADFRQYYGVGLHDIPLSEAADLAACLPSESRCIKALVPEAQYSLEEYLLSNIEYWLHWLVWAKTDDGQANRKRPAPILTAHTKEEKFSMTVDELEAFFKRPRRELK